MLLPADLLLSLTSAQQSGRPEASGQSVLPVVDVAAVQSWLDTPGGQGDNARPDPRALINQLLSGMTEQQSDSFAADFVHNLRTLLPPEQPRQPAVSTDLLSADGGAHSDGAESGLPAQWTVDELLKFSEQILPAPQSQLAPDNEGGSELPPGEQNLPQVLLSALAVLQSQALQGSSRPDQPGKQTPATNQPAVPGFAVAGQTALSQSLALTLPVGDSDPVAPLSGQGVPLTQGRESSDAVPWKRLQGLPMTEAQSQFQTRSRPSELIQLGQAAVASTATEPQFADQTTVPAAVIPRVAAVPSAEMKSAAIVFDADSPQVQLSDPKTVLSAETARARLQASDALTLTDTPIHADRRPLAAAIDAALQSGAADLGRTLDAVVSRQDTTATLLSTAAPTAGELAQELYGADQRRQLAAQAREATAASQPLSAASRALGDNLQMGSFGQTQWGENVSRQLLMMTANGVNSAQIRLDPPELGALTIKVKLIDQVATVNFVSQHAMVREALELQIPRLQEQFRQEGMELVDVSVSDQSAQQGGGQRDEGHGGRGDGLSGIDDEEVLPGETVVRQSSHLIDFYA
jgi:flagellar hook-length control protein FliK